MPGFKQFVKGGSAGALKAIVVFYKQATPNGVKDKSGLLAPSEPPVYRKKRKSFRLHGSFL